MSDNDDHDLTERDRAVTLLSLRTDIVRAGNPLLSRSEALRQALLENPEDAEIAIGESE